VEHFANNSIVGLVIDEFPTISDVLLTYFKDSQLKAFADKHGIPVPQPRKRDTALQKLRSSYETVAKKAGETASYPGNWLYETWSESGKLVCQ
jgi:hypothetical protein